MQDASANYFKQVAGQWDDLRTGYFGEQVRETALSKAYLRPEMTVADIGAGTGFLSTALAAVSAQVHAVDASAEMLAVARNNLSQHSNISYHEADGAAIPLPDASMDAVFANMYLHHTPDPLTAIREMVRILKPGGRLVITDLDRHEHTWMRSEMADEWLGFERETVRRWYRQAGLVNVLLDCTGADCCAESETDTDKPAAEISVFVAVGTKRVETRKSVEQRYTLAAEQGCGCGSQTANNLQPADCCAPAPASPAGYLLTDLQFVPQEAEEVSLGCGNPLALANLQPGETVLDIGSGGGIDVFLAARRVGPQGRVIGVDMTPAMLERARRTAEKHGYTNVSFRQGEAEHLPVADSSVDVVISNCVINLTEDKAQVFAEIARVLQPGGRMEISDTVTSGALSEATRLDAGQWAACISGSLPEQEYLDLIRQAGFSLERADRKPAYQSSAGEAILSLTLSAVKNEPGCGSSCCEAC